MNTEHLKPTEAELIEVERIKSLLPLTVDVTSDEFGKVKIWESSDCIGARTLKKAIPSELFDVRWGVKTGAFVRHGLDKHFTTWKDALITIQSSHDMMEIKGFTTVTLSLGVNPLES